MPEFNIMPTERRELRNLDLAGRLRDTLESREIAGAGFPTLTGVEFCPDIWGEPPEHVKHARPSGTNNSTLVYADACISPVDYLRIQALAISGRWRGEDEEVTAEETMDSVMGTIRQSDRLHELVDALREGVALPLPHTGLDREMGPISQEGRHRATAAYIAGHTRIRVRFAADGSRKEGWSYNGIPSMTDMERYLDETVIPAYNREKE